MSNVRVRINVISFDRFIDDPEAFRRGLTWPELHQYLSLFWQNQKPEIMERLTPAQRHERQLLQERRIELPDPFLSVCNAHRSLLVPPADEIEPRPVVIEKGTPASAGAAPTPPAPAPARPQPATDPQQEVIDALACSRQVVLAPPGTGKTHAVIRRLAHLARTEFQGDLSPVLLVSFSRAAAAEISQRLALQLLQAGSPVGNLPRLSTLDSFAGRLLGELGIDFPDQGHDASIRLLATILEGGRGEDPQRRARNLIVQRIRCVVIDEVQDVLGVRARLVVALLGALAAHRHGLLVLGDLRQAIHGFALKTQQTGEQQMDAFWLIRQVRGMYADLRELTFTTQHRFAPGCQTFMTGLREAMDDPSGVHLPGERPDRGRLRELLQHVPRLEDPLYLASEEWADRRVAVLARNNTEVRQLDVACRDVLLKHGRRVRIVGRAGNTGYPGWLGRTLQGHTVHQTLSGDTFIRHYKERVRDDRAEAEARLEWVAAACGVSPAGFRVRDIVETIRRDPVIPTDLREQPVAGEVWLSTIHQAKGREFDLVVLARPDRLLSGGADDAEEARLLYVATTRAKREVMQCGGRDWLPEIFEWEDGHIRTEPDGARDPGTWAREQDALWHCLQGLGRCRIIGSNDRFVLEISGDSSTRAGLLSESFARAFEQHARGAGVPLPSRHVFRARLIGLQTVATGREDAPLGLVPEFSGHIQS